MKKKSSAQARSLAWPTPKQRVVLILELLQHLESDDALLTPIEVLRSARFIPGWSIRIKHQRSATFEVDAPRTPGLALNRNNLIALLISRWVNDAHSDLGGLGF